MFLFKQKSRNQTDNAVKNLDYQNNKNNDYDLQHKFSRTNFNATQNYYRLMQIADIINHFAYKYSTPLMSGH
ncbi:MAG: hypothetical protein PWQ17_2155 [Anaerophaga sp.]|nr:hypothetical protein [Anaerophaga sp.]MDN5292044.1 hypothetical protein [Anaerophaga sp.]